MIVLLFWVYLVTSVMLFGAEVAAEVPRVLHEEPRHGDAPEGNWRTSLVAMLRGLVLAGDNDVEARRQTAGAPPAPNPPEARHLRED